MNDTPVISTVAPPTTPPTVPSTTSIIPTSAPLSTSDPSSSSLHLSHSHALSQFPPTKFSPSTGDTMDDLPQYAPLTASTPSLSSHDHQSQQTFDSSEDDHSQAPPGPFVPSESTPDPIVSEESTGEMRTSKVPEEIQDQSEEKVKRPSTITLKGFTAAFVTKVTVRTARESPPPPEERMNIQEDEETTLPSFTDGTSHEPTTLAYTSTTESYVPSCTVLAIICSFLPWLQ